MTKQTDEHTSNPDISNNNNNNNNTMISNSIMEELSISPSSTSSTSSTSSSSSLLYSSALRALLSSDHQAMTKEEIQKTSQRRTRTVQDMILYMKRIGLLLDQDATVSSSSSSSSSSTSLSSTQQQPLTIIHVAGTKGKGSVCAMCEAIMRKQQQQQPKGRYCWNTGLFTSPHLVDIRERIRINGRPISKHIFGTVYWHIRQRLLSFNKTNNDGNGNDNDDDPDVPLLPGYFRMITLLALYIFKHYRTAQQESINCIILEVGMGGRYDATNIPIPFPSCNIYNGITLIDYDHVRILGNTLPEIAWEKGGIYMIHKGEYQQRTTTPHPGREREEYIQALAAFNEQQQNQQQQVLDSQKQQDEQHNQTTHQFFALDINEESVIDVFRLCAYNEGCNHCPVQLTGPNHNPQLPSHIELGLRGSHQRINAELAIALCRAAILAVPEMDHTTMYNNMYEALTEMTWPGRCQTVEYQPPKNTTAATTTTTDTSAIPVMIRLDGAHTIQSVRAGLEWYNSVTTSPIGDNSNRNPCRILLFNCSHERNPIELLDLLYPAKFHAVYFCVADTERPSAIRKESLFDLWQSSSKYQMNHTSMIEQYVHQNQPTTWEDTLLGIWKLIEATSSSSSSSTMHSSSSTVRTTPTTMDCTSNLNCYDALQRGIQFATTTTATSNRFTNIEFFCTGSLYLVGSMLSAIEWHEEEATGTVDLI